MDYRIKDGMPSPQEWQYLRNLSEWEVFTKPIFKAAAKNSVFGVCVYDSDKIIGMGRIVGDGIICFYIQDIFVVNEYRNKQVGTLILNNLLMYIKEHAEKGSTIALFSHIGTENFYKHFGFLIREKNGKGSGMYLPYFKLQELYL